MNIKVRSIPSSGLSFESSVMPREIGLTEDFINPEQPVTVNGLFERVGEFVLARVEMTCGIENHCARCLERLSRRETFKYSLEFELAPGQEYIDVGERLREEMILGHVPRTLCREDCKGICPGCGAELNTEQCECKEKNKE
ncbi:MAG: DUF177 domain-containing protein [Candidatus Omnitrophica bacterium]|nr:DUF177 domain-containing protein [Candidatus Omnitrophota bacterium]